MKYNNEYPINDEQMEYNVEKHMYILKPCYIYEQTGIDLNLMINSPYIVDKNTAVEKLLADISSQIYKFVYRHNRRYQKYVEYLMAKSPEARENIKEALFAQLSYIVRNGKINEFVGVNTSFNDRNAANLLEDLRGDRAIHPEAIDALSTPLEDGEILLYTGQFKVPNGIIYRQGY